MELAAPHQDKDNSELVSPLQDPCLRGLERGSASWSCSSRPSRRASASNENSLSLPGACHHLAITLLLCVRSAKHLAGSRAAVSAHARGGWALTDVSAVARPAAPEPPQAYSQPESCSRSRTQCGSARFAPQGSHVGISEGCLANIRLSVVFSPALFSSVLLVALGFFRSADELVIDRVSLGTARAGPDRTFCLFPHVVFRREAIRGRAGSPEAGSRLGVLGSASRPSRHLPILLPWGHSRAHGTGESCNRPHGFHLVWDLSRDEIVPSCMCDARVGMRRRAANSEVVTKKQFSHRRRAWTPCLS